MSQITPNYRVLGGLVAGLIGVAVFSGAQASAEPLVPAPPPAPAGPGVAAPAPQNVISPGALNGNRFTASPPSASPAPTVTPAGSGTIREYLQAKGVRFEPQKPQGFKALDITLPVPPRWTQVPDPNVPDAFAVIADRQGNSVYTSNAQVVVYKLVGDFDPRDAITHGYVDSQKLLAWQTTNASMADFGGFPSSVMEGTYRDGDMLLNTSRRNVIATSGHDRYLVSLSVTTDRSQAVADAPATDAIINGFRVTAPGAATAAPAPAPVSPPAGVPAQAPQHSPVGLPGQTPTGAAPVGLPGQAAGTAPLGLPGQAAGQPPAAQPRPNLLTLVPGLPPLPNFSFLQR
ncbi:LpqN/LpqT family lipoprotein [Mycobacterium sp. 663a-19]|uniref:LpqN/LpqT family lipoprotein n=1 Tax=Mycobacterium sp. 663a-19 TaxID=2986148 RepID=UPI002D1F8D9C|nr:LpqN/LpqT family lipoprotein [Mycobacterium sp. 663a-19]MEB3980828.1 LpqN/LpqT family lipoprotein [Mycobacterium sp. 663a-19]